MPEIKHLIQAACVVAIALGGGLFAFGNYLEPQLVIGDPAEMVRTFDVDRNTHVEASLARGVGVGFMSLGALGLIVPWFNVLIAANRPIANAPDVIS